MSSKTFFFLSRFSNQYLREKFNQESNLSLTNKVLGISSLITNAGHEVEIIVTNTGNIKNSKLDKTSEGKIKILKPRSFNILNLRYINYLLNIISTLIIIKKLNSHNSYFILWDYLPDSVIPVLLAKIPKVNIIMDLEEKIQDDPEAGAFFKWFEKFFENKITDNYFSPNSEIIKEKKKKLLLPGFFSKNLNEEKELIRKLDDRIDSNSSDKDNLKLIFSGRFDSNRGIYNFVEIAQKFKDNDSLSFEIFGFGNQEIRKKIQELSLKQSNLKLFYEADRETLLDHLINSDIAFNYLSNQQFISGSFPSKMVELINFSPVILSNFSVQNLKTDRIILFDGTTEDACRKIIQIRKRFNELMDQFEHDVKKRVFLDRFSIEKKSVEMRKFIDEI